MQAIYAWYTSGYNPAETFDANLRDFAEEIRDNERRKGESGDSRLLRSLFFHTIERHEEFDEMIQKKAENWELERIALVDRILMQMGICEMLTFEEIPIKVTINEYLEIAKKYSTPKSSKFLNGILDGLYADFRETGEIKKSGRGLVEETPRRPEGPPEGRAPRKRKRIRRSGPTPSQGPSDGPMPPAPEDEDNNPENPNNDTNS